MTTIAKNEIEILNQLIDDEEGIYRVRARSRVHYLTIPSNVFDDSTMCRPYLLIPQLPDFPDHEWTKMHITRDHETQKLTTTLSSEPLPGIHHLWHPTFVDVLSLTPIRRYQQRVREVLYSGKPAIAKIACFDTELRYIERETWAHQILVENRLPEEGPFAPAFLAHLTENGRVMGYLMEKAEGEFAGPQDLSRCQQLLRRLHALGLVHGDVNRYNFVVDRKPGGSTLLLDWEHAEGYGEQIAREELDSLPSELSETTGRGKPSIWEY